MLRICALFRSRHSSNAKHVGESLSFARPDSPLTSRHTHNVVRCISYTRIDAANPNDASAGFRSQVIGLAYLESLRAIPDTRGITIARAIAFGWPAVGIFLVEDCVSLVGRRRLVLITPRRREGGLICPQRRIRVFCRTAGIVRRDRRTTSSSAGAVPLRQGPPPWRGPPAGLC